jgi:hypothetical protein
MSRDVTGVSPLLFLSRNDNQNHNGLPARTAPGQAKPPPLSGALQRMV